MGKGAQNQNLHQRRRKKKLSKKSASWKFWLLIKVNNLVHGQRDSKSTVVKVNGQKQQQLQFEQESANSWCVVCDMAKEVLVDMTYDGKIVWSE